MTHETLIFTATDVSRLLDDVRNATAVPRASASWQDVAAAVLAA